MTFFKLTTIDLTELHVWEQWEQQSVSHLIELIHDLNTQTVSRTVDGQLTLAKVKI